MIVRVGFIPNFLNGISNSDQVRINLANTFLKENRAEEALQTLSQVGDVKGRNFLSFLNLQTKGYLIQNDLTRSDSLLQLTESAFDSLFDFL